MLNTTPPEPCPFCGSITGPRLTSVPDRVNGQMYFVACECGASGPASAKPNESARKWNARCRPALREESLAQSLESKANAVAWLRQQYQDKIKVSPLGENVAWLLDKMWRIHNAPAKLSKVDWGNNHHIVLVINREMATIDNNGLTRLVIIAHQMRLRVSVEGASNGYLRLMFHHRTSRDKAAGISAYCPDIYDHVDSITAYHPTIEEIENV